MDTPLVTSDYNGLVKSVILYSVGPPLYWSTTATIQGGGDLLIRDGDDANEWWFAVSAAQKYVVLNTLIGNINCVLPDDSDERLLTLLAVKFAHDKDCYSAIEAFLISIGIETRSDCWINF